MPATLLPPHEQYRYVTYAPTGGRWAIDWTHEREWRWCMTDDASLAMFEAEIKKMGIVDEVKSIPGLHLYAGKLQAVLVAEDIDDPAKIRDPDEEADAVAAVSINLDLFFAPNPEKDADIEVQVDILINQVEAEAGEVVPGESRGSWLWIVDPAHTVTRALVRNNRLVFNRDGKYLLPLQKFSKNAGAAPA